MAFLTVQGQLNRVQTHVVVPAYPQLSAPASYMAKGQAVVTFDGKAVEQPPTATGIVNSPAPFVMAQIVLNLLRSQPIIALYYAQLQANAVIGTVQVVPDSLTLGTFTFSNCSIVEAPDPGAFDGMDPTSRVTISGVYYINAALWAGMPAS